jgi:cytochrome c6
LRESRAPGRINKHKPCAILGNQCAAAAVGYWHYGRDKTAGTNKLRWSPVPSLTISPLKNMKTRSQLLTTGIIFLASATLGLAAPAAENWENHCTKCHGEDGKGQTKVGKKLKLKDYTDAKVQAEMKDEDMIKATAEGILDAAGKEKMKAYKDELSADEIKDLVAYIRKFKA